MPDLLDDVFDATIPFAALRFERMNALNVPIARKRIVRLLRAIPVSGDRVPVIAAILGHLGPAKMAAALGPLAADDAIPAINRAAPALVLMQADLDPQVPPAQLPAFLEALLVGGATTAILAGCPITPLLPMFLLGGVDADALIARIERWRAPTAIPANTVYGLTLELPECAAFHDRILALMQRDTAFDATGRAWMGPIDDERGGRAIEAHITVGDHAPLYLTGHFDGATCVDGALMPLLGAATVDDQRREMEDNPDLTEIPIGQVAATAATATGETWDDERVLWLLHRVRPDDHGAPVAG